MITLESALDVFRLLPIYPGERCDMTRHYLGDEYMIIFQSAVDGKTRARLLYGRDIRSVSSFESAARQRLDEMREEAAESLH